ncbi:MAG: CoA pyrophosphatase [Desulfobulbaceae bacterium]|nr:CoA pyrophosphatase [Desulfobulbaceae bacterium]
MPDFDDITTALLRQRLNKTRRPVDPTDVVLPAGSDEWPYRLKRQLTATLMPAGVLIPVIERDTTGLSLLLTQRSAELNHHAGQVSFPGGRWEPNDTDIVGTALRETYEEVGIAPGDIAVIGYLSPMPTITGYAVTPVIGVVRGDVGLHLDHKEVEYAFEVPLPFLMNPDNQKMVERDVEGKAVAMAEYHYDGQRIWGATAFIIQKFVKIVAKE